MQNNNLIEIFNIYNILKRILKNKKPALNKAVKVRRLTAARLHKNVFGLRPLHVFVPPHFFVRWNCFAIPLSRTKKRQLPPNVKCHAQGLCGGII